MKCHYVVAGTRCGQMAEDWRTLPLRTDLPSPDHVDVPLCNLHAKAVDMWLHSQRVRASGA